MKGRVTLAQIAETCGTSIGTVSRAINDKSDINEETRTEILRVAYELGYRSPKIPEFGKIYRIGVVYCKASYSFYNEVTEGVLSASEKWYDAGIRVNILQTERLDQESQIDLLKSISLSEYDALVINCAGKQTSDFIKKLRTEGFPVATFNTDAAYSDRLFFIGADSFSSGYLGGGLLAKFINKSGSIAMLGSFSGNESRKERLAGFCSVLEKEFPNINIIPVFRYSDNIEESKELIKQIVENNTDLVGLFPSNSTTSRGAMLALEELQKSTIHVVGYDLSPETKKGLVNGYCDAVLFQNPYLQGYLAVKLMAKFLLYNSLPTEEHCIIPTEIITKYNLVWNANC